MNAQNTHDQERQPLISPEESQSQKLVLTSGEIVDRLKVARMEALQEALDNPHGQANLQDGIYYQLKQPEAKGGSSESDRLNLYKQTAVALISARHFKGNEGLDSKEVLDALNDKIKSNQDPKKSEAKLIQEFTAEKLKIHRKTVKKMLKRAEGIMMTRVIPDDRRLLHQSTSEDGLHFETSRVGNLMYSALLKGEDVLRNPPRNHREMVFTSKRGVVQGDVHSYLVAGTDTKDLVKKSRERRAAINNFFGEKETDPKLEDVHIYRTLIDGDDNYASMVTNKFKADNESKLAKDALKGDKAAGIERINTTQKVSALGVFRKNKVIMRQLEAAIAGYEGALNKIESGDASAADISRGYNEMNRSLLGLEEDATLPAGVEANKDSIKGVLKEKVAELKYLQAAYKAATPGVGARMWAAVKRLFGIRSAKTFADPRVMKPVIEGMIINRVGGGSMSCKSGKDRAGVISGIEVAAEKQLATMNCDQLEKATSDVTAVFENKGFAQSMYSETTEDYLMQIGADNCDGVFGTKDGHKIVPEVISSYLKVGILTRLTRMIGFMAENAFKMNPEVKATILTRLDRAMASSIDKAFEKDEYQKMNDAFKASHKGAKINEIGEVSRWGQSLASFPLAEEGSSSCLGRDQSVLLAKNPLGETVIQGIKRGAESVDHSSTPGSHPEPMDDRRDSPHP